MSNIPSVQQVQSMIQDYSQALQPKLADTLQNCFVAVQKHPRRAKSTELMTVNSANGLMWIYPETGPTGWGHSTSDIFGAPIDSATHAPMAPARLLPFYQRDVLYTFCEFDNGTDTPTLAVMQWSPDGGWAQGNISIAAQQAIAKMGQTNLLVDGEGRGYLYGLSAAYPSLGPTLIILGITPHGEGLDVIYMGAVSQLTASGSETASVALLPGPGKDDFVILAIDGNTATFQPVVLQEGQINNSGPMSAPQTLNIPAPAQIGSIVPIPNGLAQLPSFLLVSQQDQQLYAVVGNGLDGAAQAAAYQLTGAANQPASVMSVSGGLESGGKFAVFAVDGTTGKLWTSTQLTDPSGYGWVALGNSAIAMTAPISMAGASEVLICDQYLVVSRLTQSATTSAWFTLPIMTPSPPSDPIAETATYTQQFTLTQPNGVPMVHAPVQIWSDPPQVLIVNSMAYHAAPSEPVTVLTDASGSITVATTATGLASPVLSMSTPGQEDATPSSYRGDLQLHQRIAGQTPGFQITGQLLLQKNLLPATTSQSDADQFASTMQSLGGVAVNMATQSSSSSPSAAPYSVLIDVSGSTLQCRTLGQDELARYTPTADSWLDDAWGDVANFCKNTWDDIEHLVLTIAEDTATIVVKLFDATKSFVLTTIDDIRDALEVMIAAIAKFMEDAYKLIKDFIDFLKLIFDWQNIKNTKIVLEYFVTQMLQAMQDDTTAATQWINNQFGTVQKEVNTFFNDIASIFDPNLTFQQAAASDPSTAATQATMQANAVQLNYGWSKAMSGVIAPAPSTARADTVNPAVQAYVDAFENAFADSEEELNQAWQTIVTMAKQINSVSSFLDFAIVAVLEACQVFIDLVLSLIQSFLDTVLGLMDSVAQYTAQRMTRTIKVPVISAIYKWLFGSEMTLLDMACMCLAIGSTVMYEIEHDSAPFDSQQVATILQTPIKWPWSEDFDARQPWPEVVNGKALADVLSMAAAIANFTYLWLDGYCDIVNITGQDKISIDNENKEHAGKASSFALLTNIAAAVLGAPWFAPQPGVSPAAGWQLGAFAAAFPPIISDGLFLEFSDDLTRFQVLSEEITEKALLAGPWACAVFGALQVAVGSAAVYAMGHDTGGYSYSGWDKATVIVPGFSNLGKPLTFLGAGGDENPELTAAAMVSTLAFDSVGDLGSLFANLLATYD